jgi:hypothetical protein
MEIGVHNGTSWSMITPYTGLTPTGTATLRTVGYPTTSFGSFAVGNIGVVTSVPAINNEIISALLMPNIVSNNTVLRVVSQKTLKTTWTITDASGRTVMTFNRQIAAAQNDIPLWLGHLAQGVYYLTGESEKGRITTLKFIRM